MRSLEVNPGAMLYRGLGHVLHRIAGQSPAGGDADGVRGPGLVRGGVAAAVTGLAIGPLRTGRGVKVSGYARHADGARPAAAGGR